MCTGARQRASFRTNKVSVYSLFCHSNFVLGVGFHFLGVIKDNSLVQFVRIVGDFVCVAFALSFRLLSSATFFPIQVSQLN